MFDTASIWGAATGTSRPRYDRKHRSEKLESLPNPFTTVLEGLSGQRINAAKKSASHAPLHTMDDLNFPQKVAVATACTLQTRPRLAITDGSFDLGWCWLRAAAGLGHEVHNACV